MKKKVISLAITLMCIIAMIPSLVFAGDINTSEFSGIYKAQGTSKVTTAGGKILGVAQAIGISCGVIFLVILGIKYMTSSTDDKATIKEKLIPYVIGAVIMFGGSAILGMIANFARNM